MRAMERTTMALAIAALGMLEVVSAKAVSGCFLNMYDVSADDIIPLACQNDSDGVLTCVPNSLRRREAGNPGKFSQHPYHEPHSNLARCVPVDACNGKNNYGVGHSCSWNAGGGVSEGSMCISSQYVQRFS